MKLLIDTSFIISLLNPNDSNHKLAVQNKSLLTENDCYITNSIILETITVLMQRLKDIGIVRKSYNYLKDNFTLLNETDIGNYNDDVFMLFQKYNQNNLKVSFIDCSLVLVSKVNGLDGIVSFDKGFGLFNDINWINPI